MQHFEPADLHTHYRLQGAGQSYLVTRGAMGVCRFEFSSKAGQEQPKVDLPLDDQVGLRLACLAAFSHRNVLVRVRLRPTSYQVARLAQMLAILDRFRDDHGQPVRVRTIAAEIVFPGSVMPSRAIEWKSSIYRRQTQRLIAAAQAMRADGYRHLLLGRMDGGRPPARMELQSI